MKDQLLILADKRALTDATAQTILDLGEGKDAFGNALSHNYEVGLREANYWNIVINDDVAGATGVQYALEHADAEAGPFTTADQHSISGDDLKAGADFWRSLPKNLKRFVRITPTPTGTATGGVYTAWIGLPSNH